MTATASAEVEPTEESAKEEPAKELTKEESETVALNRKLNALDDSSAILDVFEKSGDTVNAVNVATTLHRLASINKKQRVGREALFRDARFSHLMDAVDEHSEEFKPRSVADVLWSLATLQHWPAKLLKPVITALVKTLEKKGFEAQHLSTIVWALASLNARPQRLSGFNDVVDDMASVPKSVADIILAKIETQAVPIVDSMNPQNCANLLWGYAKLGYQPSTLLPKLAPALLEPNMLSVAKPVEVSDLAYALAELEAPASEYADLIVALADRAKPETNLSAFSSRHLVNLICSLERLQAMDLLAEGVLDDWVNAVRMLHGNKRLISDDAERLEKTLKALGLDATWVKRSEMLTSWVDMADGKARDKKARKYTTADLRAAFDAIDTDNSGDIDQAELLEAIQQFNPDADAKTVEGMLSFADRDGDRQVSFEEFKDIMLKQSKRVKA
jgi:Ca2+-binding EF-hand superfamily protein